MTKPQPLPSVLVLLQGFLVRDGLALTDASSTVTLVDSGDHRLIVDTGSPRDEPKLKSALIALGVPPDSIEYVVNTHLHIDHVGCNDMFRKARFVAHAFEDPPIGTIKVSSRKGLLPGVDLVPTPGHTAGSLSVFVSSDRRYAISGDAIPTKSNFDQHTPPVINVNRTLALRSMEAILEWAEVVVPGHDPPFDVIATSKSVEGNHHRS